MGSCYARMSSKCVTADPCNLGFLQYFCCLLIHEPWGGQIQYRDCIWSWAFHGLLFSRPWPGSGSLLFSIYCEKKLLQWGLKESLRCGSKVKNLRAVYYCVHLAVNWCSVLPRACDRQSVIGVWFSPQYQAWAPCCRVSFKSNQKVHGYFCNTEKHWV